MKHDLSKLHPIHREAYLGFAFGVTDELYDFWLGLNESIPDLIGKDPKTMTKANKERLQARVQTKPITVIRPV